MRLKSASTGLAWAMNQNHPSFSSGGGASQRKAGSAVSSRVTNPPSSGIARAHPQPLGDVGDRRGPLALDQSHRNPVGRAGRGPFAHADDQPGAPQVDHTERRAEPEADRRVGQPPRAHRHRQALGHRLKDRRRVALGERQPWGQRREQAADERDGVERAVGVLG